MIMDPAYVTKKDLLDGAIEFLQYARAAFKVHAFFLSVWISQTTLVYE